MIAFRNKIEWTTKSLKQLRKIDSRYRKPIKNAVSELESFPTCKGDVKDLKNKEGFRLRVGKYRAIFTHDQVIKLVNIEEVKKRDERTY
jgi:mRNA interferase RelE/StbE